MKCPKGRKKYIKVNGKKTCGTKNQIRYWKSLRGRSKKRRVRKNKTIQSTFSLNMMWWSDEFEKPYWSNNGIQTWVEPKYYSIPPRTRKLLEQKNMLSKYSGKEIKIYYSGDSTAQTAVSATAQNKENSLRKQFFEKMTENF